MKTNTLTGCLSFLLIVALFACQPEVKSTQIADIQEADFSYQISVVNAQLNAEGETQCSSFRSISTSDENIQLEATDLQHSLAAFLQVDKKDVLIETDQLKNAYFNIEYKGKVTPKNSARVLNRLLDYYELELDTVQVNKRVYSLYICDEEKLKAYQTASNQENNVQSRVITEDSIRFKNLPLSDMSASFQDIYPSRFEYTGKNHTGYSIAFVFPKDPKELFQRLHKDFGIAAKDTLKSIKMYNVIPQKSAGQKSISTKNQ